jgi:hypothetical protein
MDYTLWESGKNYGLDGSSRNMLASKGFQPLMLDMKTLGIEVLDVKYADNITPHEVIYQGEKVDSISIDVTIFDQLQNYNTITHRTNPSKKTTSKVRVIEIATGLIKAFIPSMARELVDMNLYKFEE